MRAAIDGRCDGGILLAIRVDGCEWDSSRHLGEMHLGGLAFGHGTHAGITNDACTAASHQDGLLEAGVELNVGALESTNDTFAITEEPGFRVRECVGFALVERCGGAACRAAVGTERVVAEPTEDNDLLAGHKHEVFWLGGRIVDECGARADAALLEGEAGPCVEGVCVHFEEEGGMDWMKKWWRWGRSARQARADIIPRSVQTKHGQNTAG